MASAPGSTTRTGVSGRRPDTVTLPPCPSTSICSSALRSPYHVGKRLNDTRAPRCQPVPRHTREEQHAALPFLHQNRALQEPHLRGRPAVRRNGLHRVASAQLRYEGHAVDGVLGADPILPLPPAVQTGHVLMAQAVVDNLPGAFALAEQESVVRLRELKIQPVRFRPVCLGASSIRGPPGVEARANDFGFLLPRARRPE